MKIKKKIFENLFAYRWWSIFYNPFHITRRKLLKGISRHKSQMQGQVLDFGCGGKPYKHLFPSTNYIGCDIEKSGHNHTNEQIDFFYNGISISKPNASFDNVFTSEVIEHIFNPDQILQEIHRVLKDGGHLLLSCPFFWNEHEMPYDYCRYSSAGLRNLLQRNGFRIVEQSKLGNRSSVFFQLLNLFVYDFLDFHQKAWILGTPLYFIFNFGDLVFGRNFSEDSLYLSNLVLACTVANQ